MINNNNNNNNNNDNNNNININNNIHNVYLIKCFYQQESFKGAVQ